MGGWPTFLLNLCAELKDEFEFHFIATDNKDINPKFHKLGKAQYMGQNFESINHYLITHSLDIVQYGNKAWPGKLAKNTPNPPVVIERTAGPRSCKIDRSHVDHVVASNTGTIPIIRNNYDGPITMIRNGLDTEYFESIEPDRLHFAPDDIVVCYCARMGGKGQGFDMLINAILHARKKRDIKLVLIGDKPKHAAEDIRPQLRKLAEPLEEDCVFTGALDDPLPIMAGADIYACPAKHHGISNSLIEAAALGKPLVATNVGQTTEIVHDGRNGFLVRPNEMMTMAEFIVQLASLPRQRERLGHYGKGLVKREFNIKVQAAKYRDLYMKLLSEAK